jgi:hypothetical protein
MTEQEATITPSSKTFTNIAKANWQLFKEKTEEMFGRTVLPDRTTASPPKMERVFRHILTKVSRRCVPSGRHRTHQPGISAEAKKLMKQRDQLRVNDPTSPNITILNDRITRAIDQEKRDKWHGFVETLDHTGGSRNLWKVIKALDGRPKPPPNCTLDFAGKQPSNSNDIANLLNKQFTSTRPHMSDKLMRQVVRKVKSRPLDCQLSFCSAEVSKAIKRAKNSKASGPDGITVLHLKHLGPRGLDYLTAIFNASIRHCSIPAIWKSSTIVPLLKPGKDAKASTSYRPISLLFPAVKVMEALLLPLI